MLTYHQQLLVLPLVNAEILNAESLLNELGEEKVSRTINEDYIDQLTSIQATILKGH